MKRNIEISISKKFSNYCLTTCLVLLLYVTYSFISQQSNRNSQAILNGSSEVILAHREIEDSIKYASIIVQNIKKEIQQNAQDKQHIANTLKKFRILYNSEDLTDILSISMFSWVDKDKKLSINSEFGILDNPIDLSNRDYIPLTIKEPEEVHMGSPVVGAVSKQHIIPFGVGVVDKAGVYQGTIVAGINIFGIYKKIITTNHAPNSSVQIFFDKVNDVISGQIADNNKFLNQIDFDKTEVQLVKDFPFFNSGNAMLYKNIRNSKYGVLMTLDNRYSDQNYLKQNYLIEAISISSIFLFLIFFFRKVFIRPITRLSKLAKTISNGDTNIKIPRGNIKEINKLAEAITEIKDFVVVERALKMELQSQTNLLNATSHDLKNYISGINGLVDLILEDKSDNKAGKNEGFALLNVVSKQTKELMYFVEDLLDTSQGRLGELKTSQIEAINLREIIDRIILLNKNLLLRNKTDVIIKIQDDLPEFYGDARRIKQIFNNLITNAVKYSPKYSPISISVIFLPKNNEFCVEIQDNGIGMTNEEIKLALSGHGESIDKSGLDKKVDSHGVGMMVIQSLVELHHGKFEINSKKGIGSTFRILFPTLRNNTTLPSDANKRISRNLDKKILTKLSGKKIILAEDDPVNVMILSKKLSEDYKIEIQSAKDGDELFDTYKKSIETQNTVDLIISDISMPKLDGIEAAKKIREYEEKNNLKQVPIIAYCGDGNPSMFNKIKKAGMNGLFVKGDDFEGLIKEIDKVIF